MPSPGAFLRSGLAARGQTDSDRDGGESQRPVLIGRVGEIRSFQLTGRGSSKVGLPSRARQSQRLDSRFEGLSEAFEEEVTLSESLGAADPELVVVFEALDERLDLSGVARRLGFEVITESEGEEAPSTDFPRTSKRDPQAPITSTLHAVCLDRSAMEQLLESWTQWKDAGRLPWGSGALAELFSHLNDVRAWGPTDRLATTSWDSYFADALPGTSHEVELELWYRGSEALRMKAESEVSALVEEAGGEVLFVAQVADVGYHGMKCSVSLDLLRDLARGAYDSVALVKSSHLMYLRVSGQSHILSGPVPATAPSPTGPLPAGDPVLCVVDGVPVVNHPLLAGRVTVSDPDDLDGSSTAFVSERRHGTAMASVAIWGDLGDPQTPSRRPVLVRPILEPSPKTVSHSEELREVDLAPDLMVRVFRELFEGNPTTPPIGETVVVLNLSVGDPATAFDSMMSAWARAIDWLSYHYGVLIIVSAGNHGAIPVADVASIKALAGEERGRAVLEAVHAVAASRRLISPAESINAVTVGALHSDNAGTVPVGYRFDPADGHLMVSPISAIGLGHRRSIKPDLVAPGGRVFFRDPLPGSAGPGLLEAVISPSYGPGIRVAASDGLSEAYTTGTSPAAAITAHRAAEAVDIVRDAARPGSLTRRQLAVGAKALLLHGTRASDPLLVPTGAEVLSQGHGSEVRDFADGCAENEAVMLFFGELGANELCDVEMPLPDGLQSRGIKRVSATLAWLSPINWRHREYRRASLSFAKPEGMTSLPSPLDVPTAAAKRGTVQHLVWEIGRAVPFGQGSSLQLTVRCAEQAGGLSGERVQFAVALSLWVAPELDVDVYVQVRDQLQARVGVTPTS